jgi:hypothetical protein
MTLSRTLGRLFIATLLTATVAIVVLTGWLVGRLHWPAWRERTIEQAVLASSGPAFWWPPSWRQDYERRLSQRVLILRVLEFLERSDTAPDMTSIAVQALTEAAVSASETTSPPGRETDR